MMWTAFLAPVRSSRTYLRLLYLVLAFPLGTTYFIALLTAVSTGVSLAIVVVGVVLLALTVVAWRAAGWFERLLAVHLLGAPVPPSPPVLERQPSLRAWASKLLRESYTWRSLVYLLAEFPFGLVSFTLVVVLLGVSISLLAYPLFYLLAISGVISGTDFTLGTSVDGTFWVFPGVRAGHTVDPLVFLFTLGVGAVGAVMAVASLHLLDGIGRLWGQFAVLMLGADQTEARLAQAEAQVVSQSERADRADQSRRQLVVSASHELRTPVASIRGHLESLLNDQSDVELDPKTRRYLEIMDDETRRLSALVDDVLALARAESGELRLDLRPVDVSEVVTQVSETLAPLARRERKLSLAHTSEPGLPPVLADRDRLAQVLTNLVRNAINHTPDGGLISVGASTSDGKVLVTVSDTGIGMAPEDLPQIFDRFYRTDQARSRDAGGFGLGLAIVRELLTAMGATIEVDSTPGVGSQFRVMLRPAPAGVPIGSASGAS